MKVFLQKKLRSKLKKISKEFSRNEIGGVIIGNAFSKHIIFTDITFPSIMDTLQRFSFIRKKTRAQKIINTIWKKSKGTEIYLGEWHTHPENDPKPSDVDEEMINEAYLYNKICLGYVFLVIVGFKSIWIGIKTNKNKLTFIKRIKM